MGLYNFEARFVPFIEARTKKHTIRKRRKNVDRPGKTMYLYTGLRRKGARLIMKARCTHVDDITIGVDERIWIGGVLLDRREVEQLARTDGFKNFTEMMDYWKAKKDLPFVGHIIHWSER